MKLQKWITNFNVLRRNRGFDMLPLEFPRLPSFPIRSSLSRNFLPSDLLSSHFSLLLSPSLPVDFSLVPDQAPVQAALDEGGRSDKYRATGGGANGDPESDRIQT